MTDDWPPDWEDPADEEFPSEADETQLAEVAAFLAAVSAPAMPDAVEARISAAFAAEAASRASGSGASADGVSVGATSANGVPADGVPAVRISADGADPADGARTLRPIKSRFRPLRRAGGAGRHPARARQFIAAASVAAFLVIAGVGYGLSRGGSPTTVDSGSAAAGPSPVVQSYAAAPAKAAPRVPKATGKTALNNIAPTTAPTAVAPTHRPASGSARSTSSSARSTSSPKPKASVSGSATSSSGPAESAPASATRSRRASPTPSTPAASSPSPAPTLPVSLSPVSPTATPTTPAPSTPAPTTPAPSKSAGVTTFLVRSSDTDYEPATLVAQVQATLSDPGSGTGPSSTLKGCVSTVTGGPLPRLVDLATYQGSPAYIIATSSEVWVVGTGCTATDTELVTSVPLAG